jgi:tRNA A37 threonylcarbamoyladenosine synthetase subunit TsaC/SUA5/YrdC
MAYFGDSVDFYVDIGDLGERPPSTIIGFNSSGKVIMYRQGAVEL